MYDENEKTQKIGGLEMNLAKVSCNGQITVPVEIRRALKIKSGDKIVFLQNKDGEITMQNLDIEALTKGKMQKQAN